jgi:hypothetical protein
VFEFTVRGARAAAERGELDDWVHEFLTTDGLGTNLPMATGLRLQPRWWLGPVRVPLASLDRICGPEPDMPYRTTINAWNERVSSIMAAAMDPEALPPLILEYTEAGLQLCDGNHRHEALRRLGEEAVWAIVWCNSEDQHRSIRGTDGPTDSAA